MRLAFCLYKYFLFGGVQRNFRRVAELCLERGHTVDAFTLKWEGPPLEGVNSRVVPVRAVRNHKRYEALGRAVADAAERQAYDLVVGFNKMPGLDLYYNGDPCYVARMHEQEAWFYRLSARYRGFCRLERAVFAPDADTRIMVLSEVEKRYFVRWYGTPEARFYVLPPYVSPDRMAPDDVAPYRARLRAELGLDAADRVVVMVGSGFERKGVDRAVRALAALPEEARERTFLLVIGEGRERRYYRLAKRLGVGHRFRILAGHDAIGPFLFGADLLVHPAYEENTGTAIVEGLAAGLPVLATDVCGYAFHVRNAHAGALIPSPYRQADFDRILARALEPACLAAWAGNARRYSRDTDLYSRPERIVEIIEHMGAMGPRQARAVAS